MNNNNVIRMSFFHNSSIELLPTSAWEINHTKWQRLEKLCVSFLKWTKCLRHHFDKNQLVTSIVIDKDKTAREIIRIAYDQLTMVGLRPKEILIGRKQMEAICEDMKGLNCLQPFEFSVDFAKNFDNSGIRLFNIPVKVIPHMDGILVL